jgi:hypothetical protein
MRGVLLYGDNRRGSRGTPPVGPAPCDACEFSARCRRERLACSAFEVFVAREISPEHPAAAERVPSRARYRLIFGAEDQRLEDLGELA